MKQIPLMGFDLNPAPQGGKPDRNQSRQKNGRRRSRKRKRNYTLHYIILFFAIAVTLVVLSFTVLFNVNTITVAGDKVSINHDDIIGYSGLKQGDSLLLINKKKVEKQIMNNTYLLDGVKVKRKFPSGVELQLIEAKPTTSIKFDKKYYYFSENMRLMSVESSNTVPTITCYVGVTMPKDIVPGGYLNAKDAVGLETCLNIKKMIDDGEYKDISYVDMSNDVNISVFYKEQIQIKIGTVTDFEYKLDSAKRVIEQKITDGQVGLLDVQIERKAYFRQAEIKLP